MSSMKSIAIAATFLAVLLPAAPGNPKVRAVLNNYNFLALERIDKGEAPKFVLAAMGGKEKIGGAEVDLADVLVNAMNESGRFLAVERGKLDKVMKEQALGMTGLIDESKSAKVGELLGADFVAVGSFTGTSISTNDKTAFLEVVADLSMSVSFVNASSGERVVSTEGAGSAKSKLIVDGTGKLISGAADFNALFQQSAKKAVVSAIPKLKKVFPLIGFVVKVDNRTITCDLGKKFADITDKSFFAVGRKGAVNSHPVTKKVMSVDFDYLGYGKMKELKNAASDIAMTEIIPSAKIKPGDLVIFLDGYAGP